MGLGIDADDGLGVGLAEMDPAIGEIDLHAVAVVDLVILVRRLDLSENGVDIDTWTEVDTVLGDDVIGVCGTELGEAHLGLGHLREHEGDTYKRVAAIVALRINDTAIAFAANDGVGLLHHGDDIHLADSRGGVGAAVTLGDVAEGAGRGEIADRRARSEREDIVGDAYDGVLLAKHGAIFADEGETVDIGVDNDAEVGLLLDDEGRDVGEVLWQRLGIVGEIAVWLKIETVDGLDPEAFEELWENDAADGIDGIEGDSQPCLAHGIGIDEFEGEDLVDMVIGVVLDGERADVVDICGLVILLLGNGEHLSPLLSGEELTLIVEEFEGVPLLWVVAGCDDYSSVRVLGSYGYLGCRRRGEVDIDDIGSHSEEDTRNDVANHLAGDAGVASDNNLNLLPLIVGLNPSGVGGDEADEVGRR